MQDHQQQAQERATIAPTSGDTADEGRKPLERALFRPSESDPSPLATAFKVPIDMLRDYVPSGARIKFEEEFAAIGYRQTERLLTELDQPVALLWGDIVVEMYDFCSKWLQVYPLVTLPLINKHEEIAHQFFEFFDKLGDHAVGLPGAVSARLSARRLYWRNQALKMLADEQDEDRRRQAVERPHPGEVVRVFLAKHRISETELLGRIEGSFSKNTLVKIKNGQPVRSSRYTALAIAMAEIEPGFDRAKLLPLGIAAPPKKKSGSRATSRRSRT